VDGCSTLSGAPLGERLGHFFDGAGLLILEGYGLTETTGGATVNTPTHVEIGSVGRPVPGSSVRSRRTARCSEGRPDLPRLLAERRRHGRGAVRRRLVLERRHRRADDDGFLRITGRKKDLIVTAGGKNVAPAVLEDLVRADRLISQCVVVGDASPSSPAWSRWTTRSCRPSPSSTGCRRVTT
jgi:long-chain acyl-CoA synthetase